MPRFSKENVKRGMFLTSSNPGCRGDFIGDQTLPPDYEHDYTERPAPRRPLVKSGLTSDKLAEIEAQYGAGIAEIKRRLDAVKAGLDALKAKRR